MDYYTLFSENAIGVYNSWDKARQGLIYAIGHRYAKKYSTYDDANEAGLARLKAIALGKAIPKELPMNFLVRVNDLAPIIIPFRVIGSVT